MNGDLESFTCSLEEEGEVKRLVSRRATVFTISVASLPGLKERASNVILRDPTDELDMVRAGRHRRKKKKKRLFLSGSLGS